MDEDKNESCMPHMEYESTDDAHQSSAMSLKGASAGPKEQPDDQKVREQHGDAHIPFIDLKDSPMFRQKVQELIQSHDASYERTKKVLQGAKKYCNALDDAFQASLKFSDCIESLCDSDAPKRGGDEENLKSIMIGGPILARFVQSMRELSSFLELLRTQIELIVCDGLGGGCDALAMEVKECSRAAHQKSHEYASVRSKYLGGHRVSGKKHTDGANMSGTMMVHSSRAAHDEARFDLAKILTVSQDHFKFELIESIASVMQAQIKYFEHGHTVAQGLMPYVEKSLEYVEALRGESNARIEKMNELIAYERACSKEHEQLLRNAEDDRLKAEFGILEPEQRESHQGAQHQGNQNKGDLMTELSMLIEQTQKSGQAQVTILKQGYLSKKSSKRNKWQRRFFVLDSTGMLYYYSSKTEGVHMSDIIRRAEKPQYPQTTVNLVTAAVKPGLVGMDGDIPYSFSIISPEREYFLQADDEIDASSWIETLQGVIVCLLSGAFKSPDPELHIRETHHFLPNISPLKPTHSRDVSEDFSRLVLKEFDKDPVSLQTEYLDAGESVESILLKIPGNTACADCGADNPDWASINLGSLYCIECSGIHRNMGVHISKIRSLSLDTRVWDDDMVVLFRLLGNEFVNEVWEAEFQVVSTSFEHVKPLPSSSAAEKEIFIRKKYVEKAYVRKVPGEPSADLWSAIEQQDTKACYMALVHLDQNSPMPSLEASLLARQVGSKVDDHGSFAPTALHRAAQFNNTSVLLLLLVSGKFQVDALDGSGRSALMYALHFDNPASAKLLLKHGACKNITDFQGDTPLTWLRAHGKASLKCASDPDLLRLLIE